MLNLPDLLIPAASAHEKWFVAAAATLPPATAFQSFRPATIAGFLAVAAAVAVGYILDRRFERSGLHRRMEERIRPLRDYGAIAVAASTGFYFLWLSAHGSFLADNFSVASLGAFGLALSFLQAVVGAFLIIGLYTPVTSAAIVLLYLALFAFFPWREPLDYLHYPGIGIFLYYFSRNRYSLDWFLGKPIFSTPEVRKRAYLALRVLTGLSFAILASYKFLTPEAHLQLMAQYSQFNPYVILQWLGFSFLTPEAYVFCLFLVELAFAIIITFGLLTRFAAALLMPIFLLGAIFLGFGDIIGHLPIVGALFAFVLFGDTYHKSPLK